MSLARPAFLWLIAATAVVVLLHIVPPRRRAMRVAFLGLWRDAALCARRRRRWARLHSVLSLLSAIGAVVLLAVALAGPSLSAQVPLQRLVVYVLDNSAGMATVESDGNRRFNVAAHALRSELAKLRPGDRAALVLVCPGGAIVAGPTTARAPLLDALARADVAEVEGDLRSALDAPLSLAGREDLVIRVFTDAAGETGAQDDWPGAVSFAQLGFAERENIGIVDLVWQDADGPGAKALVSVLNAGEKDVTALLSVTAGETELAAEHVDLPAGATREVALALAPLATGPVVLRLYPHDAFALDNLALVYHRGPPAVAIALKSDVPPGPFTLAALESLAGFGERVRIVGPGEEVAPAERRLEVDLRRDRRGEELSCATLLLGTREGMPFLAPRPAQGAVPWGWSSEHPVTRGLDFTNLRLERAAVAHSHPGQALVETSEGAWAVAAEANGWRFVWLGGRPEDGNLHLLASFPALMQSAVRWLVSATKGPPAFVRTGAAPGHGARIVYLGPERTDGEGDPRAEGAARADFARVGLYRVDADGERGYTAANLLSARESRIAPRQMSAPTIPSATVQVKRPVWAWVTVAALLAAVSQFAFATLARRAG